MLVAGAALAVVVGAMLAYLSGSSGTAVNIHLAGLVVMVVGLLALASVLVGAIIGLRRTGKHRRSGLVADAGLEAAQPVPDPPVLARPAPRVRTRNPSPANRRDQGSGRSHTDNFGYGSSSNPTSGYEGSHASRSYDESAVRRDTPAGW